MNTSFQNCRALATALAQDYASTHNLSDADIFPDDLTENFLDFAEAQLANT